MRYPLRDRKPQIVIGDKIGKLTCVSDPFYIHSEGSVKHRRQHADFLCDCNTLVQNVNISNLKKGAKKPFCQKCLEKHRINDLPKNVPEDSKLVKLGQQINNLVVVEEAVYSRKPGDANRHKYVKCQCMLCDNIKLYREDKFAKGLFKSCGCLWEHQSKSLTGITKVCCRCKKELDLIMFNHNKSACKSCMRNSHLLKTYNITQQEYEQLLTKQNNKCACCGVEQEQAGFSLRVDHSHTTGKIRGLLCSKCNTGIGMFNDSIELLSKVIEYLNSAS